VNESFSFADKNSLAKRTGKTKPLEIRYRGRPTFEHSFEIIEMSQSKIPILIGRDLIPKLGIVIENIAYTFEDQEKITFEDQVDEEEYIPNVSKACSEKEYKAFMTNMAPYLEANSKINLQELCPSKEAVVYLNTPPNKTVQIKQYPIAYSLRPVVREQIEKWAKDRTIEPASLSGFNSPLTLVPKPSQDGKTKWRTCLDTRGINNLLEDVANVNTPLIEDIFHAIRNSKVYSVFDISGAFHRLKINKVDRHKLTFTFEGKSWHFRGACFGLKPLSAIYQNLMETILADMKEFTCVYIDDLICHSKDIVTHEEHCKRVIEALTKYKLPINQEKTHLARNSVYLLGFCISEQGKSIDPRRLTNIDNWPKPQTAKAMMKFCGWVSYMRTHLPNASDLTAPLDHLRYSTKKVLEWTPEMHIHYDSIINIIKYNIVLSHPDLNHEFSLSVDASQYAVGACLFQEFVDKEKGTKTIKYIGFASKALSSSQRSYSVTKKELYALTTGLKRFYKFLYGNKPFKCYTDHRSLSYLFTTKHISMMMMRYMETILSFPNMKVIWIPGKENIISDKLSRLFPTEQDHINYEKEEKVMFPQLFPKTKTKIQSKIKHERLKALKKEKQNKKQSGHLPNKQEFIKNNKNINAERLHNFSQYYISLDEQNCNYQIRIITRSIKTIHDELDNQILDSGDTDHFQINYVQKMDESFITPPEKDREDILRTAHTFGHFGAEAIVQRIRKDEGMNWPNILKDALEIAKQCSTCQKFVISKRGYNPLKPLYCYTPGWHYQMDLCGPFPCTSSNNTYILVLIDVATRFVILRPIPDKSAKSVVKELIHIFSLMGYPRILNSDRGMEFKNAIMDELCEAMKIDKRLSTAYYSQSNGGAERAVQTTKKLLSKLILGISEDNWDMIVNSVQLMINCKISKRLLTSPFNLMFARKMSNEYPLFADPTETIQPMSNDELLQRIEYMSDVVYPAIKNRTDAYNKIMKDQFDKNHRIIHIPVGSFVVVRKKGIQKALAPVYEGPYEVIRKTDHNNYTLRDELGVLLPREYTPSELKLVSQDAIVSKEEVYEFDAIVAHRGEPGKREYKVRWKNYTAADDSWITADMFTDPQAIAKYWKRVKGAVPPADATTLQRDSTNDAAFRVQHNHSSSLSRTTDTIATAVTTTSPPDRSRQSRHRDSPKRAQRRTCSHTKPVANNPVHNEFHRHRYITRAVDNTKYKR
jgi:transposase InsO family protein